MYRERCLLTQLRTGIIGFHAFLVERRVPVVESERCAFESDAMTVRHVLLARPK
jgi:hypothetical protein